MTSASSRFALRGLSMSQIQKFIPKKWKGSTKEIDLQKNYPILGECKSGNESMIENLVNSLKEFASQGNLLKAFKTFSLIQRHASCSTSDDVVLHSVSSLLLSCVNLKSLSQGKQLHTLIISLGFEQHPIIVPKLVTFYTNFDLLADAHTITENSNILHPLPWNLLISSYVRNGLHGEALSAYKQMTHKGIRPDKFTYPSVLKACGEKLDIAFGKKLHASINASCLGWNLFVHNSLVSMYAKTGELSTARCLFENMLERDDVSWNTMISGYASKGMWKEAFELFGKMRVEGIELNIITWNTIAGGCVQSGNFEEALELLSHMRSYGIDMDSVATIIGLGACSHIGAIKLGREIHGSAIRSFYDGVDNVKNALITMYSRCKYLRHAYNLFQSTRTKNIITWNSMLSGYTHMDRSEEASFLFREMLLSGIEPNYVTIASILPLCARVANLQHGKEFHCYILRRAGFKDYLLLWNSLVDMYARSGKVLEAKRLFDSISRRDEVTYTSLIAGYGIQGEGREALKLFDEMKKRHIKPDHVTMVAVLSACSHSGLVTEGIKLFELMPSAYGIIPRLEHFACMVDLFGRAGLLHKAKEMITRMPYRPSSAMWATLLGACRIHGNAEIGEWAAEKLLEMRPENSGYYVLIANMYAAAGCWSKLAKVRTYMRDLGVRKAPGCAWVDVGSGFFPFLVDDTSKPHVNKLYPLLEGLTELMKDAEYVGKENVGSVDDVIEAIG
ncbi:pentatricopeptide repeat-containing protein At1g71490 [Ricinus communis]|uniref:pentatricopeptide repeat-containing protein At1g71490 n=1 Tax=Ricinus communis TaxID=3988 RepID=UPI00201AA4D4|nr:pentatricopeptide repeat-containing protein At1g71490 [Ricinus communis]XP_015580170.2 pentatricopeptide repeat-containing protein At1g71490 [Ricinus communis]XP_015580171.2 pentatricopeptide repeat-containing protein At1g71490 [Ricinus communis]XP_015580173.2 pentatricopeptide repeat-containing protein At1g71490 [Ricinus communis]XP_015580174.2 pentatricopeptide repeat-containing protein At1g71490 [Ricinus communis]XP_015580175.2 pentatricopeptide repeat-containing protein At1g71490 [Ricin